MPNIKAGLAAGYRPSDALRGCLLPSVSKWAEERGLDQKAVSALINGSTSRPFRRVRHEMAETLRVERWWLDELLDEIRLTRLAANREG